jgi:hypothetical protein
MHYYIEKGGVARRHYKLRSGFDPRQTHGTEKIYLLPVVPNPPRVMFGISSVSCHSG